MRKLAALFTFLLVSAIVLGASVSKEKAQQVANNYYSHFSGKSDLNILDSYNHEYNGILTYYVFNYRAGGFVVIAADDAITPVLAESAEGYFNVNIDVPSVRYWFNEYDKEIAHVIAAKYDNSKTLAEWNQILGNQYLKSTNDVGPLLSTNWDQGQWYNYNCPTGSGGPGGHVYAGCVATTMGQVMKYYAFPAQGFLSHSYVHSTYGTQTANFGATTYNWGAMGTSATSSSYQAIANLLYHTGVSVDMDYGVDGSGAFSEDVPWAMTTYFNYDPRTITLEDKTNYTNTGWKNMLMAELDLNHPIYYSGDDGTTGHAWVCDGYQTSTGKFHMNWGWSGMYNGYFAIGSLNAGGYTPNSNNKVVKGIKPYNSSLVVRFTDMYPNQPIGFGSAFDVNCSVLAGTATTVNLYVDGSQIYTTALNTFTYPWNTGESTLGSHVLRVEALNATDTVYHEVTIGLSEWIPQASGFASASRGINHLHAVDSLVAWGTAYDGANTSNYIQEWARTEDGGETWITGTINGTTGMEPAMVFAIDNQKAYVPMYRQTGSNPQGIYVTTNGGTSWSRQTSASFTNSASFPNVVHFFNSNEGFCMGDPISGDFEIYTTTNGGTTWTQVPGGNIANPVSGEFGIVGYYSAVGDKAWFGTNKGRIYRTADKGLHWEASTATLGVKYLDIEMADELHGLCQDKSENSTGALSETFDGGVTWATVSVLGQVGTNDFCHVPGTADTWVSTEANSAVTLGAFYSFDGGHSWSHFEGTEVNQYLAVDFANNHCGWAGGFNETSTSGGMFKYVGMLEPGQVLNSVTGLAAQVTENTVHLSWNQPVGGGTIVGYNVFRNDTLITASPISALMFDDLSVPNGKQTYCVTAVYDNGESEQVCVDAWVTVGIPNTDPAAFRVYPNPATDLINVITPLQFSRVSLLNMVGQEVYNYNASGNNLRIVTDGLDKGMYLMKIYIENNVITKKISIR